MHLTVDCATASFSSRAMPASVRIQESFDAEILADSRFGLAAGTGKKFIVGSNQVILTPRLRNQVRVWPP